MPEAFNRHFDLALAGGKEWENALRDLLTAGEIECKRDYATHRTGNVFVELECRGKPSGLTITKANWWAFAICNAEGYDIETFLCASVPWLRERWERWTGILVPGGETDYAGGPKVSKGFIIPVVEFANRRQP